MVKASNLQGAKETKRKGYLVEICQKILIQEKRSSATEKEKSGQEDNDSRVKRRGKVKLKRREGLKEERKS